MGAEWRRCRLCGALLAPLGIVMAGEIVLLMHDDGGFTYAGTLIYAMAAYAFYMITMAIRNVVRYRRYRSPVMSSARVMSLASAAVSHARARGRDAIAVRLGGRHGFPKHNDNPIRLCGVCAADRDGRIHDSPLHARTAPGQGRYRQCLRKNSATATLQSSRRR